MFDGDGYNKTLLVREAATYFSAELVCNGRTPPQCSGQNGPTIAKVKRSEKNVKKPKLSKLLFFFYQMSKVIQDIKGGVGYPQILQKHFPQRRGGGCHPILPSFSWKNKHIILLTKTLTSGNFNLFLALFWFILGPVWSTFNLVLRKNTISSCFR